MRAAALAAALSTSACALPMALTVAGSTLAGAKAVYDFASQVQGGIAQGIEIQCRALIAKEATLTALGNGAKVAATEKWSGASAFCNPANPPPSDPIAAAFWLGSVVASMN